ncbi:VOC family protein [Mesorhizobium sp. M0012]|uniref:VOC family protein n=1 Tax=Mesorhizobium sp. M0012 TaxID=2956840 RepID=UPI0033368A9E
MELVGLDHYAINVRDLQRSADWYQLAFGFGILHKWNSTWMVGRGNMKVGLFLRPTAPDIGDVQTVITIQHVAFLVDGDKFADSKAHLINSGIAIFDEEDTGIAYSFFLKDPDGHLLEITTYHPAAV